MVVVRFHKFCDSNLDLNSGFYRFGNSQNRKGSLNLKFQRLLINFNHHHHHHLRLSSHFPLKICRSSARRYGFCLPPRLLQVRAMDEDVGVSSFHDWGDNNEAIEYRFSSSEGEDSDGDIILQPITDVDLPTPKEELYPADDSITTAAHRLSMLRKAYKRKKTKYGILNNIGLITFSTVLLSLVDCCAWKIVRLPLAPLYLMRPFLISAVVVSCAGYVCVPLFRSLNLQSVIKKKGTARHSCKKGTPTMGGLYFIPIGVIVAEIIVGFSSLEVLGASAATLTFAAIGLLDDLISMKSNNFGLSTRFRNILEIAAGTFFSFWLYASDISSPYSMKTVVPLPVPLGLICLGRLYPFLTSFCFVSMANGINLTDGLDGLAGGTATLAFIAMSIAVLPICSELSIFGASMAGACTGFLLHNRYKASICMGDTGALALGGALASMAACTGMFLPLFISSGVFVLEALSFILQVSFFKTTEYFRGTGLRLFRMAPLHHHLELCGVKEPVIVAGAYICSCILALSAGYVGLTSV